MPLLPIRPPRPSIAAAVALGAAVGASSMGALAVVQLVAAVNAQMLWTVGSPGLSLAAHVVLGAALGAALGCVLEIVGRLGVPRLDGRAWVAGVVALLAYGLRAMLTAALRARYDMPGGQVGALVAQGAVVVALALVLVLAIHRRQRRDEGPSTRRAFVDATWAGALAAAAVTIGHVVWLASKEEARRAGLLGPTALAVTGGCGLVGLVLGVLAWRPVAGGAATLRRGVAVLVAAAGLTWGVVELRPGDGRAGAPPTTDGPNVLLIVLDTLRRDAVSAYGLVEDTTPVLDELAAEGVLWQDAVANGSWTVPSHASLFTGATVSRHGAGHFRRRLRSRPAGPDSAPLPTLAELFSARGWRSDAFVCNMNLSRANGFDRGFGRYHEVWRAGQGDWDVVALLGRALFGYGVFDSGGRATTRGVASWLADRAGDERPWLLFVNFMEPHTPYDQIPERHLRRFLRDGEPSSSAQSLLDDALAYVYAGGVRAVDADELWRTYLGGVAYQDELLGEVLDALDASGAADDTIVVVTSDHGENFGWRRLLGHGQDLNDDLVRIPLVARGPGLPRGVVDPTPASLMDLLPTLVALTGGGELPPDPGRLGVVLSGRPDPGAAERIRVVEKLPLFLDDVLDFQELAPDGELTWAWGRAGLYRGSTKYVEVQGPVPPDLGRRLTVPDRQAHPPHHDGRASLDDPSQLTELSELLRELRASWPHAGESAAAEPDASDDEELREQLRALGYIGG